MNCGCGAIRWSCRSTWRSDVPVGRALGMDDENVVPFERPIGPPGRPAWHRLCRLTSGDMPVPDLANVMVALRHDGELRDVFAFDEMLRAAVVTHEIGSIETVNRWVTDNDAARLCVWLQQRG